MGVSVTEVIGVSSESWEAAARSAVETAAKTVRDLRIAEVLRQDVSIEDGTIKNYRVRLWRSRSSTRAASRRGRLKRALGAAPPRASPSAARSKGHRGYKDLATNAAASEKKKKKRVDCSRPCPGPFVRLRYQRVGARRRRFTGVYKTGAGGSPCHDKDERRALRSERRHGSLRSAGARLLGTAAVQVCRPSPCLRAWALRSARRR